MSETSKLQISKTTAAKLNDLAAALHPTLKRPGASPIAEKILDEAISAIVSEEDPLFTLPIVALLHNQLHGLKPPKISFPSVSAPASSDHEFRIALLEKKYADMLAARDESESLRVAEDPAKKKGGK